MQAIYMAIEWESHMYINNAQRLDRFLLLSYEDNKYHQKDHENKENFHDEPSIWGNAVEIF